MTLQYWIKIPWCSFIRLLSILLSGYTDPYDTAIDKTGLIKGTFCDDKDECTDGTHNCHAQATCTNIFPAFTCKCNAEYSGDGINCIPDTCPIGFQQSGSNCVNIDQCAKGKLSSENPDGHDCDDKGEYQHWISVEYQLWLTTSKWLNFFVFQDSVLKPIKSYMCWYTSTWCWYS